MYVCMYVTFFSENSNFGVVVALRVSAVACAGLEGLGAGLRYSLIFLSSGMHGGPVARQGAPVHNSI